ncbi:MAG: DUF6531 domain-containing protein, partial [Pirellulales bacterium]
MLATFTWDGGGDQTSWHDATNWLGDQAPTAADDATVPAAFSAATVTISVNTSVRRIDSQASLSISGATMTTEFVVAPHLAMSSNSTLTTFDSIATTVHKLELEIAGTLTIDLTSRIDVTGKGYLPGRTTGNTIDGAATVNGGGSYGGLGGIGTTSGSGNGVPNAVYGDYTDYAEPNHWGSGGGSGGVGGGLVRLQAQTLQLDGQILASGFTPPDTGGFAFGGGSGGGVLIRAGTLVGTGSIEATGSDGTQFVAQNAQGFSYGGSGGGGRVAVHAQDLSGFDAVNITAHGGLPGPGGRSAPGGAGTVFIKDTDNQHGTLILDAGTGGAGTTPLGLADDTTLPIPDAVVIRGAGTHVVPQHAGLLLDFRNTLTIEASGGLTVAAASLNLGGTVTLASGGTLRITSGTFSPPVPLIFNGGVLAVTGILSPEIPLDIGPASRVLVNGSLSTGRSLNVTGTGFLSVSDTLTSMLPLTVTAGTIAAGRIRAPSISLVNGAELTSLESTESQMHKLEVQVAGTILVDATSKIDVSSKGYLPGRTKGNTTVGAATQLGGGSYGGLGSGGFAGTTNAVYGDYADPEEWGSGGTRFNLQDHTDGGGLVRLRSQALILHGQLLADGLGPTLSMGGGGSGGSIFVDADTLSGTGTIRAAGGAGVGGNAGGGGGGRIAVYARDSSGFNLQNVSAPGGMAPGNGRAGTVHVVQGNLHTHVRSHAPTGRNKGHLSSGLDAVTLQFNKPIEVSTLISSLAIAGPLGAIAATEIRLVGDREYEIVFPRQTVNGRYNFTLLPTLLDAEGVPLDQNANGIPGELVPSGMSRIVRSTEPVPDTDHYQFTLIVDTVAPRLTNHTPAGDIAGTVESLDIWFSESIDKTTLSTADLAITVPGGQVIAPTSVQEVGLNRFRIRFAPQTATGRYQVRIGPDIRDLAGNLLDQDHDGTPSEATVSFNLVPVDLGLSNLQVEPTQLWVGEQVTITWNGANRSGAPLIGSWFDGVYLSTDDRWDITDILLGIDDHPGGLAENEPYPGEVSTILPGVLPGMYHFIVRADIRNDAREGLGEADNVISSGSIAVGVRGLPTTGVPAEGLLTADDPADYYAVFVPGGEHLGLVLDGQAVSGVNELFISFESIPTRQVSDYRAIGDENLIEQLDRMIAVTAPPGGGTFFVLAHGADVENETPYSITANVGDLVVTGITPNRGTASPPLQSLRTPAIITITGAGFDQSTTVDFIGPDNVVRSPESTTVLSPSTITLNLDLTDWPAAEYTVRICKGDTTVLRPAAFRVLSSGQPNLVTNLVLPSALGFNIPIRQTIWIEYRNDGDAAMHAPILTIEGDSGALITDDFDLAVPFRGFDSASVGVTNSVQVMARGSGATPGILQPGDSGRIPIYYIGLSRPGNYPRISFTVRATQVDDEVSRIVEGVDGPYLDDHSVPWVSFNNLGLRPEFMPPDAWAAIVENMSQMVGPDWANYVVGLNDNMNFLHAVGVETNDVTELYGYEVAQASANLNPIRYLAGSVDASVPALGIPLSFSRVFGQSIASRYTDGPLGRGWAHNWHVRADVLSNGDIILRGPGGADRYFTRQRDGSLKPAAGDFSSLAFVGGAYQLTETDQTIWRFRPDGKLDFMADPNGNRVSLTYDAEGQLVTLTHSTGAQLRLEYNAAGRIARLVNPLGPGTDDDLVTSYNYDVSGEHLIGVTQPGNRITDYNYDTGANAARRHALRGVTYPDGTSDHFTYDAFGRLILTSADGGAEALSFQYDSAGGVTIADATSRKTFLAYGLNGRLEQVRDGDGRTVNFDNCDCGHLRALIGPSGERYNYDYDTRGNLTGIRDPLRHDVAFEYDATFNQITSVIDARGNGMQYGYDERGNLTSITSEEDSRERYTYDDAGNLLTYSNRRGQTITYTYNAVGQVTGKDNPDTPGVDYVYSYDTAGNLVSATDHAGTTKMQYEPATNFLTRIDYPGGLFFTFAYDALGRRTQRTDQGGHEENLTYDAVGRLDVMTDENDTLIVDYDYDDAGRLSRKKLGNGVFTEYTYDNAGNILSLVNRRVDGSILSRFDYTYDASGNRVSMTTLDYAFIYGYDPLGQLTSATRTDLATGEIDVTTYVYDTAGNRLQVVENGNATTYATNDLNQYTTVGNVLYRYDLDGNMISKVEHGITTSYSYDVENRLIGVSTPTDTWTYDYDAFGQRISTSHNGAGAFPFCGGSFVGFSGVM